MDEVPIFPREKPFELSLDGDDAIFFLCKAKALRKAPDVGVNRDGRNIFPLEEENRSRLVTDARKRCQLVHFDRDLRVETRNDFP